MRKKKKELFDDSLPSSPIPHFFPPPTFPHSLLSFLTRSLPTNYPFLSLQNTHLILKVNTGAKKNREIFMRLNVSSVFQMVFLFRAGIIPSNLSNKRKEGRLLLIPCRVLTTLSTKTSPIKKEG
jgi:hypothetical protein